MKVLHCLLEYYDEESQPQLALRFVMAAVDSGGAVGYGL